MVSSFLHGWRCNPACGESKKESPADFCRILLVIKNTEEINHAGQKADAGNTTDKRIEESATRIIASMYQMDQMDNFPDIHLYKNTITE